MPFYFMFNLYHLNLLNYKNTTSEFVKAFVKSLPARRLQTATATTINNNSDSIIAITQKSIFVSSDGTQFFMNRSLVELTKS